MIDGMCPTCGNSDGPSTCTCLNGAADVVLKSEDFIDLKNAGTPGKRIKNLGAETPKPAEPTEPIKGGVDEGSGGKVDKIRKAAMAMTAKKAEVSMAKPPTKPPTPSNPPMAKAGFGAKLAGVAAAGALALGAGVKPAAAAEPRFPEPSMGVKRDAALPTDQHLNVYRGGVDAARHPERAAAAKKPVIPGRALAAGAAPKVAAPPVAAPPKLAANFGKSEKDGGKKDDLGNCAMCKKAEHPGDCK